MKLVVKTADRTVAHEADFDAVSRRDLASLLLDAGIVLNRRCGGEGSCGGCNVVLEEASYVARDKPRSATPARHRQVLACQTKVTGEICVVRVPSRSQIEANGVIEGEFQLGDYRFDPSVRRIAITVPAPSLADHRSDQERFVDALRQRLDGDSVTAPLAMTRRLSRLLDGGALRLTATLAAAEESWRIIAIEAEEGSQTPYGVAVDIGTTTVAGLLVDLATGEILHRASRYNQQIAVADDVAARISAARTQDGLERLQNLIVQETVNPILDSLCHAQGIDRSDLSRIAVAGNTVMIHLFLGLDVRNIGRAPFNPVLRHPTGVTAGELSLSAYPQAPVDILPAIAGYVGGDVTADIHVAGMARRPAGTLLLDLGTNCEIVLKTDEGLIACATPAGPAFEGGGLHHGRRASAGAIARVAIGPELQFDIGCIGDRAPNGVCGSGIIDFIAEAYRCKLISRAGRLNIDMLRRHGRHARIVQEGREVNACILARAEEAEGGGEIVVTEADIAEILQAKAAVFAGVKTLLDHCGLGLETIPRLILAGGFAKHIDLANAMAIGLLPRLPQERIETVGNGALAGAYLALADRDAEAAMRRLHLRPQVIELNLVRTFEANFVQSLFLPEEQRAPALVPA